MTDPVLIARTRARDALDPSGLMVFELVAAWCDDFQRAMTWLCSPEPTVTIPLKEYERLKRESAMGWDQVRLYK